LATAKEMSPFEGGLPHAPACLGTSIRTTKTQTLRFSFLPRTMAFVFLPKQKGMLKL